MIRTIYYRPISIPYLQVMTCWPLAVIVPALQSGSIRPFIMCLRITSLYFQNQISMLLESLSIDYFSSGCFKPKFVRFFSSLRLPTVPTLPKPVSFSKLRINRPKLKTYLRHLRTSTSHHQVHGSVQHPAGHGGAG